MDPRLYAAFCELTYERTGIVLGDAKQELLLGRIHARVLELGLSGPAAYLALIEAERSELQRFVNAITTNVTAFFREPDHFRLLHRAARAAGDRGDPLRIWCSAASTGEEPWSIAITLAEALGPSARNSSVIATDINSDVLDIASAAVYSPKRVRDIEPGLRRRYFEDRGGRYRIRPELREIVQFKTLNLVSKTWPVIGPFDIVFCRNVMIYFDRGTRKDIVRRTSRLLRPGGLLLVGHSESLAGIEGSLQSRRGSVYQRPQGLERRAS